MVYLFPINMILPFCQKSKNDLPKKTLKDNISSIIEKDDIHPRIYGICSDRKIEGDKKVYSAKYT